MEKEEPEKWRDAGPGEDNGQWISLQVGPAAPCGAVCLTAVATPSSSSNRFLRVGLHICVCVCINGRRGKISHPGQCGAEQDRHKEAGTQVAEEALRTLAPTQES